MHVILTGDVFLGGDLLNQNAEGLINVSAFHAADYRVVNLEQAVSNGNDVADKCTLHTDSSAIPQLQSLSVDAANLAHNHIQDKTDSGIIETVEHLENGNIHAFGAGRNLAEARKPVWITPNLALLGYCHFDRPCLMQIRQAMENEPGVAPLRLDIIREDLDKLPHGTKVLLYFHWGQEHVWLPFYELISHARTLLADERVAGIVGMHAHRPQGYLTHNGKRAYFCLGNFLFPNFFIAPPSQITYLTQKPSNYLTTRAYHGVSRTTYKKWLPINRISLIIDYDTETETIRHHVVKQADDAPYVTDLSGLPAILVRLWVAFLSTVYCLPQWTYVPLERFTSWISWRVWRGRIFCFSVRQYGVRLFFYDLPKRCLRRLMRFLK